MKFSSAITFLLFLSTVESKVASSKNRRNTFSGVVRDTQYIDTDVLYKDYDNGPLLNSNSRSVDSYFDADLPRTVGGDNNDSLFQINGEADIKMEALKAETRMKMDALKEEAAIKMKAVEKEANIKKEEMLIQDEEIQDEEETIMMDEKLSLADQQESNAFSGVVQKRYVPRSAGNGAVVKSDHENEQAIINGFNHDQTVNHNLDKPDLNIKEKTKKGNDGVGHFIKNLDKYNENEEEPLNFVDDLDKEIEEEDKEEEDDAQAAKRDFGLYLHNLEKEFENDISTRSADQDSLQDLFEKGLNWMRENPDASREDYLHKQDELQHARIADMENKKVPNNQNDKAIEESTKAKGVHHKEQTLNMIPYSDYEIVEDSEEEMIPAFFSEEEGLEEDVGIEGKDGKDYFNENSNRIYESDNKDKTYYLGKNILSRFSGAKSHKKMKIDEMMMETDPDEMMMETDPDDMMIVANDKTEEMIIEKVKNSIVLENSGGFEEDHYNQIENSIEDDEDEEEGEYMTLLAADEDFDEFQYSSDYQEVTHDLKSQKYSNAEKAITDPSSEDYFMDEDVNYDINSNTKVRDDNSNEEFEYFSLEGDDVEYDDDDDDGLALEIKLEDDEEEEQVQNAAIENESDDEGESFVDEFDLDEENLLARAFSGRSGGVDHKDGVTMDITSRSGGNASGGGNANDTGGFLLKCFAALTVMFTVVLIFVLYSRRSNSRQSDLDLPNLFAPTGVLLKKDDTFNRDITVV